jgi:hypothetical protein
MMSEIHKLPGVPVTWTSEQEQSLIARGDNIRARVILGKEIVRENCFFDGNKNQKEKVCHLIARMQPGVDMAKYACIAYPVRRTGSQSVPVAMVLDCKGPENARQAFEAGMAGEPYLINSELNAGGDGEDVGGR